MSEIAELQQSIFELRQVVETLQTYVQELTKPVLYETQPELMQVNESSMSQGTSKVKVTGPAVVHDLLKHTAKLEQEELRLVLLNRKNVVIDIVMVFRGTMDSSIIDPRDIFRIALRRRATTVILSHNHPSGSEDPSPEDIRASKQIAEAGRLLNITVLDHVVIGKDRFLSMKERGLMP